MVKRPKTKKKRPDGTQQTNNSTESNNNDTSKKNMLEEIKAKEIKEFEILKRRERYIEQKAVFSVVLTLVQLFNHIIAYRSMTVKQAVEE